MSPNEDRGFEARAVETSVRIGLLALLVYGFSNVNDSIWKGVSWGVTFKFVFDGCLYAAVTGLTFWWLWPAAA